MLPVEHRGARVERSVLDVATKHDTVLVDVRPRSERRGELGWLPASLHLPTDDVGDAAMWLSALSTTDTVVAYCATGRRSLELVESLLEEYQGPIVSLEGGILSWSAEGLPVCGTSERPLPPYLEGVCDTDGFLKALRSCFVAEMMVHSASTGLQLDAVEILQCCCDEAGVGDDVGLTELYNLVDRLACTSRRLGTDWATVAVNTDTMIAALTQVATHVRGASTGELRTESE